MRQLSPEERGIVEGLKDPNPQKYINKPQGKKKKFSQLVKDKFRAKKF